MTKYSTDKTKFGNDNGIAVKGQARCCLFRRRKEARPGELVRAALDAFLDKGFAATRLDDVAARAGVSKGTIYLYFRNKEVLFKTVIEAGMAPAMKTIEALSASVAKTDRPAIELLRSYGDAWQHIMRESSMAGLLKLLAAESGNFPELVHWFADCVVRPAKTVMTNIVAAGIAGGEFRPIPTAIVGDMFFSLMGHCAFDRVWGGSQSSEQFLEEALDVLTRGVVKVSAD